jgi:hypothetical protein
MISKFANLFKVFAVTLIAFTFSYSTKVNSSEARSSTLHDLVTSPNSIPKKRSALSPISITLSKVKPKNKRKPKTTTATPPKGTATPPKDTATPPKGTATPPKDTATPPKDTATPPKGTATPPKDPTTATPPKDTATPPKGTATPPKDPTTVIPPKDTATPPKDPTTVIPPKDTVNPPPLATVNPIPTPFDPKSLNVESGEWWENTDPSSNIKAFRFNTDSKTVKLYFRKGSESLFNYKTFDSDEKNTGTAYIDFNLVESPDYKLETTLSIKYTNATKTLEIEMENLKPKAPRLKKITDKVLRFKVVRRKD